MTKFAAGLISLLFASGRSPWAAATDCHARVENEFKIDSHESLAFVSFFLPCTIP
jgi:hypothetical protein